MNKYLKYLNHVLSHKRLVFKECFKDGLYLHAFTHDLSKFKPCEFISYAKYFYGKYPSKENICDPKYNVEYAEDINREFEKAWRCHYKHNKHHHEYWSDGGKVERDIPTKYLKQMYCDLRAMGLMFGDTAQEYYIKNYDEFVMSKESRIKFEEIMHFDESELIDTPHLTLKEKINIFYCTSKDRLQNVDLYYKMRFNTEIHLSMLVDTELFTENKNEK